jgi:hypothetical protein
MSVTYAGCVRLPTYRVRLSWLRLPIVIMAFGPTGKLCSLITLYVLTQITVADDEMLLVAPVTALSLNDRDSPDPNPNLAPFAAT